MSKRSGNTICCVVGCNNKYGNTEQSVKFYSFPSRPHEMDLKRQWILAVNRKKPDGTLWTPSSKSSRICSNHFIGGRKSQHPASPAYVPSIFPECNRRKSRGTYSLSRFDSSNAASEETNEDDPLSGNPHQSDGDLQTVCSDSVMQDSKHEIMFAEPVTKVEPSVDSSDTTSGIDIVKFEPDFEFSPVFQKRDSEQSEILEQVSTVKKERDNFDIFGELVAHKLRHLRTDYARTTVEHLISNILYEASMGKYDFPESNTSSSASSQVTSSLISNL